MLCSDFGVGVALAMTILGGKVCRIVLLEVIMFFDGVSTASCVDAGCSDVPFNMNVEVLSSFFDSSSLLVSFSFPAFITSVAVVVSIVEVVVGVNVANAGDRGVGGLRNGIGSGYNLLGFSTVFSSLFILEALFGVSLVRFLVVRLGFGLLKTKFPRDRLLTIFVFGSCS